MQQPSKLKPRNPSVALRDVKQDTANLIAASRAFHEAEFYYQQAAKPENLHVSDKFMAYGNQWLDEAIRLTEKAVR